MGSAKRNIDRCLASPMHQPIELMCDADLYLEYGSATSDFFDSFDSLDNMKEYYEG